jgi:hypothetical protein
LTTDWRSLKYEPIYPGDFASGLDLFRALADYFHFYNHQRPHQALGYQTPADLFPHRPQATSPRHDGGAAPKPPGFTADVFQNGYFLLYSKRHLPYNRFACQEDRALQGWNPSAEASPEWMAASRPPSWSARYTI